MRSAGTRCLTRVKTAAGGSSEKDRPSDMNWAQAWQVSQARSQEIAVGYFLMAGGSGFVLLSWFGKVQWCVVMLTLIASCLAVGDAVAQLAGLKVKTIEIRGNKRIELPAISGRLTLKAGDPYQPETVRGQVKILYDTGFFEDVQVETEAVEGGTAVTFVEIGRAHV